MVGDTGCGRIFHCDGPFVPDGLSRDLNDKHTGFDMEESTELKGKKVLVAGCKKSGLGAAQLLWKAGAQPVLFDENPDLDVEGLRKTAEFLTDVPVFLKALPKEEIRSLDLAVVSPGIPVDSPALSILYDAGIPVWGEVGLAWE